MMTTMSSALPTLSPGTAGHLPPSFSGPSSRISALSNALSTMNSTTRIACRTCDGLSRRSRHLDSLTSPASETSALLARTSANLSIANAVLRDAREKFDTVVDCEPAVERLYWGAREACREVAAHAERQGRGGVLPPSMRRILAGKESRVGLRVGGSAGGAVGGVVVGGGNTTATTPLTEQELYAGADSMEIVRDAHAYFSKHLEWRSARDVMSDLEAVHRTGAEAMGLLVVGHLTGAGAAVRRKVEGAKAASAFTRAKSGSATTMTTGGGGTSATSFAMTAAERAVESASSARDRLTEALLNRDLMKSVGEYEEYLPLSTRVVRELRAIFECLGGMSSDGSGLVLWSQATPSTSAQSHPPGPEPSLPPGGKVLRTEKVGSGHYSRVTTSSRELTTGYPHLDAYGEARMSVAFASVDGYCRQLRNARKDGAQAPNGAGGGGMGGGGGGGVVTTAAAYAQNVDAAARDAVRCIEHTMVVISGEKSVYRCVVAPTSAVTSPRGSGHDGDDGEGGGAGGDANRKMSDLRYQRALVVSYSYVVSAALDRLLDLIEYTFLRDAGCAANMGTATNDAGGGVGGGGAGGGGVGNDLDIRAAASAAAAGLRIVDGVRMLGPSLSKLCEYVTVTPNVASPPESTIASALCISLHRSTVKNCSKTLENLARAIQLDPLDGPTHRPVDARVATVSSDVVHAIRVISPFVSAYKSVSKRRALPWDPNIGDGSGEMDLFVRFLIKQLLISLASKAMNYKNDEGFDSQAKSHLFMMNNTFYLLELLAPTTEYRESDQGGESYRISAPWFKQKMTKTFDTEKAKYLTYWERLNRHLTDVDDGALNYQTNKDVLSLESGRLLKSRFSGFIEDFERVYVVHRNFTVIDSKLRETLQGDIRRVFLSRYRAFFDKYSCVQFSKKNQNDYLKYPPQKLDSLIGQLFTTI
jgi:exocyst complex protein 7